MKKISVILLLSSLFIVSACQESKSTSPILITDQLAGKWSIVQVLHGFSSNLQQYPPNTIEWDFNTTAHTVTIQNNSTNTDDRYIFENGTYPYTLTPNTDASLGCLQTLTVQDVNLGCCTITNGELSFSAIYLDGDYVKLMR
jgi:hypothetical protein